MKSRTDAAGDDLVSGPVVVFVILVGVMKRKKVALWKSKIESLRR